jgi:alpha-glucosidase
MFLSDLTEGFSTNETTWLPVNENYTLLNLEAQKAAQNSHYSVYKKLTFLRKNPGFQQGQTQVAALSERVLAFTRCLSYFTLIYFDISRYRQFSDVGKVVLLWTDMILDYGE